MIYSIQKRAMLQLTRGLVCLGLPRRCPCLCPALRDPLLSVRQEARCLLGQFLQVPVAHGLGGGALLLWARTGQT